MQRGAAVENNVVVDVAARAAVITSDAFLSTVVHPIVMPLLCAVCGARASDPASTTRSARAARHRRIVCMNAGIIPANKPTIKDVGVADFVG